MTPAEHPLTTVLWWELSEPSANPHPITQQAQTIVQRLVDAIGDRNIGLTPFDYNIALDGTVLVERFTTEYVAQVQVRLDPYKSTWCVQRWDCSVSGNASDLATFVDCL